MYIYNWKDYRYTEDGIDFVIYFKGIKGPLS